MKPLTLGHAAKLAGVGAINSGRLSAERHADSFYRIEPVEPSRVYEIRIDQTPETAVQLAAPDAEVKALREMLARVYRQQAETATRLLTDQRHARSWWKRLAGSRS